ncbi:Carbonic anhydrase 1 [Geodia barretti]|uniref:carbonic anhydrase n=1 Tax=Geodia barretti TaxID=519541 RepID=A0AA35XBD0_GEOBA|nr:Carbonic anhydrase 1 [Geodia barretti]
MILSNCGGGVGQRLNTTVNFYDLLPSDRSYYYYEGSLTTPNCSEVVQWFLLKETISIPSAYLAQLREVEENEEGDRLTFNYRNTQDLAGRQVSRYPASGVPKAGEIQITTGGVSAACKAGQALSAVKVKVDSGNDPVKGREWLETFLKILRREDIGEEAVAGEIAKFYVRYAGRGSEGCAFFNSIASGEDQAVPAAQVTAQATPPPQTSPPFSSTTPTTPRSGKLNIDRDVRRAKGCLKHLDKDELKDLFQELGLYHSTVQNSYSGSTRAEYSERLIRDWIRGEDGVLTSEDYSGGATWENLRKALKELNHHGVANDSYKKYCACVKDLRRAPSLLHRRCSFAMADDGQPIEITSLNDNIDFITSSVKNSLQSFANDLVQKKFIAYEASREILGMTGVVPSKQVGLLMEEVHKIIKYGDNKREWFDKFVAIFSRDAANSELVKKLKRSVGGGTDST